MTYFNRDAFLNLSSVTGNINQTGNYSVASKILTLDPELLGGNFWTSKTGTATPRRSPSVFTLGNCLFVASGNHVRTTERYNDNTDAWTTKVGTADLYGVKGVSLGGVGYIVYGLTASLYSYNEIADVWTKMESGSDARLYVGAIALNGFIYASGGSNTAESAGVTQVNGYSPATNFWKVLTVLTTGRYGAPFTLNGFGYLAGGITVGATNEVSQYTDTTDTWTTKSTTPANIGDNAGASVNGFGYSYCGNTGSGFTNKNYEYNDVADSWATKLVNPNARQRISGGTLNGFGYACCGSDGGGDSNKIDQYRNHTLYKIPGYFKKSFKAPKRILVATSLQEDNYTVPIQIRTDGGSWLYMESNKDSLVRVGSTLSATLSPSAGVGEYVYELQVGLPSYVAGVGGGVWLSKNVPNNSYSGRGGWSEAGYGFLGCGVDNLSAASGSTEQYNDDTNLWSTKTATASVSEGPAGFSLRGMGFCYGGNNAGSGNNLTRQHNADTDSWTNRANSTAFNYPSGAPLNGFAYYGAPGNTSTHAASNNWQQYIYDTNTHVGKTTIVSNKQDAAVASVNGFVYCFGGDASGVKSNTNGLYNDSSNAWTAKATIPTAKSAHAAFVIRGTIFSCGGATAVTDGSVTNEALQYYDTIDTWYTRSTGGTARASLKAFAFNGYGYISSGYTTKLSVKTNETNQYMVNDRIPVLTVTLRVEE